MDFILKNPSNDFWTHKYPNPSPTVCPILQECLTDLPVHTLVYMGRPTCLALPFHCLNAFNSESGNTAIYTFLHVSFKDSFLRGKGPPTRGETTEKKPSGLGPGPDRRCRM